MGYPNLTVGATATRAPGTVATPGLYRPGPPSAQTDGREGKKTTPRPSTAAGELGISACSQRYKVTKPCPLVLLL